MKNRRWLLIIPIIACLVVFYGYRILDRVRTDTTPPEIHLEEQIPQISVLDPYTALLQGITVRDNADGDVTDSLVVENVSLLDSSGRITVNYAAFDRAGNVAKAQREAQYTDYECPKFTLKTPLIYTSGSTFDVLSTVGATDQIDGDIQHRVRATALSDGSIAQLGIHDVKFQVSNSLGDTASLVLPVEVLDPRQYDASLELTEYLIYISKGDTFTPSKYLKTFTRQNTTINLAFGLPSGYSLSTSGNVQTQTPGVYPVEFRVTYTIRHETDHSRDQAFTGYSKLIVVVEG